MVPRVVHRDHDVESFGEDVTFGVDSEEVVLDLESEPPFYDNYPIHSLSHFYK